MQEKVTLLPTPTVSLSGSAKISIGSTVERRGSAIQLTKLLHHDIIAVSIAHQINSHDLKGNHGGKIC